MLEAIQNPNHPEHDECLDRLGVEVDPEELDLNEISGWLQELA